MAAIVAPLVTVNGQDSVSETRRHNGRRVDSAGALEGIFG
jgi:hypothetical protein